MSGSSHRSGSGTLRRSSARRTLAAALITGRRSMIRTDGLEGAVLGGGMGQVQRSCVRANSWRERGRPSHSWQEPIDWLRSA